MSPDNFHVASGPDTGTTSIWIVNCQGNGTLNTGGCYNIIVDHVTTRWSGNKSWITTSNYTPLIDGNGNGDGPNHDITTQWTLDYEPHEGTRSGSGPQPMRLVLEPWPDLVFRRARRTSTSTTTCL